MFGMLLNNACYNGPSRYLNSMKMVPFGQTVCEQCSAGDEGVLWAFAVDVLIDAA